VATGQVQIGHYPGRRRRDFLDFLNDGPASGSRDSRDPRPSEPDQPKQDRWLGAASKVHFHFIPTYSS
jgi:hypothetical protein